MKTALIFIAGMMTTVVIMFFIGGLSENSLSGFTKFPEKAGCISGNEFKVFQVLEPNVALASGKSPGESAGNLFLGVTVLFMDENKHYYDDEIIKIPSGKCARQIGSYKYETRNGIYKTVPVVSIME